MLPFIVMFLNMLLGLLESSFGGNGNWHGWAAGGDSGNVGGTTDGNKEVEEAYTLFEMKKGDVTSADVKKKYKRLSLLHHPDRNGNSEASVAMMQKVNRAYELLEQDLDPTKGEEEEKDVHHEGPSDHEFDDDDDDNNSQQQRQARENRNKSSKKKTGKNKSSASRPKNPAKKQSNRQHQQEAEMRKSWDESRKRQAKLNREKHKIRADNVRKAREANLFTEEGRDKAHQEWLEQVREMERIRKQQTEAASTPNRDEPESSATSNMHDIDEDEVNTHAKTETEPKVPIPPPSKPKNIIMEYCNVDVVLALRAKLPAAAIDMFQATVESNTIEMLNQGVMRRNIRSREELEREKARLLAGYVVRAVDEDGNTLLHYAVYYESPEFISFLVHFAASVENLPELILKSNRHGEQASDFAKIAENPFIQTTVEGLVEVANKELERTQWLPVVQDAGRRLWVIAKTINIRASSATLLSMVVGRYCFGCGYVSSFLITASSQDMVTFGNTDVDFVGQIMGFFLSWNVLCYAFTFAWSVLSWLLLVVTVLIVMCVAGGNYVVFLVDTVLPIVLVFYKLACDCSTMAIELIPVPKMVEKHGLGRIFLLLVVLSAFHAALIPYSYLMPSTVTQLDAAALGSTETLRTAIIDDTMTEF